MKQLLDRVTASGYLADLAGRPIEVLRAMRAECQGLENAMSYVRRLAQGRLDIVGAELARRQSGGDPADLSELITQLPGILADRTRSTSVPGARPPLDMVSDDLGEEFGEELDAIFSPSDTNSLVSLDDEHLVAIREQLAAYEQLTSTRRRELHTLIDALQAEITRRYRTGEATVDSLLK